MPCHDGPPAPFTLFEARERIDQLTRFMCEAIWILERVKSHGQLPEVSLGEVKQPNMTDHLSMPARTWMRKHKAIDAQREYLEKNFKEVRQNALAKLTRDEQAALGVGDWNMKDYE